MATDTTALAEAIQAMRDAVAHGDVVDEAHRRCPTSASEGRLLQAAGHELVAGRALLAALSGVPERLAALEELAARALVFSRSFRYLSDNYTHCNCPRFDEDAQDSVDEALVALAALEKIDGD